MLRLVCIISIIILSCIDCYSQKNNYHLEQSVAFADTFIQGNPFGQQISFKKVDDNVSLLTTSDNEVYHLKVYSLSADKPNPVIDFHFNWKSKYSLADYYFVRNELFLVNNKSLVAFNYENNTYDTVVRVDGFRDCFKQIMQIDNSKFLLLKLYPNHPYDGIDKLLLYVYDNDKRQIIDTLRIKFQGISLGNIVNQWVRVINKKIYVVYPLTGKLFRYNASLQLLDSVAIQISSLTQTKNLEFITFMDDAKSIVDTELLDFKKKMGEDYVKSNVVSSDYYSKDGLMNRMDTLRKNYSYIEKLYASDDTTMIITVYKPGYEFEYRDVYFLNLNNNNITDSVIKWRCGPPKNDIINDIEDYFTVDLINSYNVEPFFYNGKIFATSSYPPELFKPGTKREIDQNIFKWTNNNNYKLWTLLEYSVRK